MTVEINGTTFHSVDKGKEKNCVNCDIFKMRPPRYMTMYPLCYEHALNKHKIYEYCHQHNIIWKKK